MIFKHLLIGCFKVKQGRERVYLGIVLFAYLFMLGMFWTCGVKLGLLTASSEWDLNSQSWVRGPQQEVAACMFYKTIHNIRNTTINMQPFSKTTNQLFNIHILQPILDKGY